MCTYKTTNWQNLYACISYNLQSPLKPRPINYKGAGGFFLLGKHTLEDEQPFTNASSYYAGQITVSFVKDKKDRVTGISFLIEGKRYEFSEGILVNESPQTGDRAQLQTVIQDALEFTDYKDTPFQFKWIPE